MTSTEQQQQYGTSERTADGSWRLRFTRRLAHPQEKVWRAITEPSQLANWFPTTIEGERAVGARLRFSFPHDLAEPIEGVMVAFDPQSLIELQWGPDLIRIELEPIGEGTLLTLLDTLEERGKSARDAAGWHTCIDALAATLAGDESARELLHAPRWHQVHPHYVEEFGPEGSTIAPPEGFDELG